MDRTCITQTDAYNGINYYVQLTLTGAGITRTVATVVNSTRRNLLNYNHTEYDLQHLRADRESADMKVITLNKPTAKRKVKCLEIPHYA